MVYFIEAVGHQLVKIGFTDGDPVDRLKQLQTGCPHKLRLRAAIPGDVAVERKYHDQFAAFRENGEWFRLAPEVEAFLAVVRYIIPILGKNAEQMQALDDRVGWLEARVLHLETQLDELPGAIDGMQPAAPLYPVGA